MVKIVACFLLGFLFVMHGLGDFTSNADAEHQGKERLLMSGKESVLNNEKEASDEISRRIIGTIGGRKMMTKQEVLKNGEPQTKSNLKDEIKIPNTAKPRHQFQVDEEKRRQLEAQREIVNLIHKDYKGGSGAGKSMGRRKPPVHNDEPHY